MTYNAERNVMVNSTFVRVMICVTIAIVLAMTALIFYRSQTVVEPSAAIIVNGDKYEAGSSIVVREHEPAGGADGRDVARTTLTSDNQYVTPILVEPGEYHVTVTAPDGQVLADEILGVGNMRVMSVELPVSVVIIGNSALLDAQVVVSGENRKRELITLSAENNYRAVVFRPPGTDQVAVSHNGKVVWDQEINIVGARSRPAAAEANRLQPGPKDRAGGG